MRPSVRTGARGLGSHSFSAFEPRYPVLKALQQRTGFPEFSPRLVQFCAELLLFFGGRVSSGIRRGVLRQTEAAIGAEGVAGWV